MDREDRKEFWEERVAIAVVDGGLSVHEAEKQASADVRKFIKEQGE